MNTAVDVADDPLSTLTEVRPRVIAGPEAFGQLQHRADADPRLARLLDRVQARADEMLSEPVCTHDIPDGRRLLAMSRRVVDRAYTLGLTYRLTRDVRYRERLWADLAAAAAFPDWNPSHFLDTAEMAHAFAVGYDWLYDDWTDAQRRMMRDAIVHHAFEPAVEVYDNRHSWWPTIGNNWNIVCHGGLVTAAIALGRETMQLSQRVIREAVKGAPHCLTHFAPDGGWPEGPMYWAYTLRYLTLMLSTMRTGLGTELGLGDMPGLAGTGKFPVDMTGPTGMAFNFADAREPRDGQLHHPEPMMAMWLSKRYQREDVLWGIDYESVSHPLAALWWATSSDDSPPSQRDAHYRSCQAVALRGDWRDRDAWYVAIQCGKNTIGHKQADLGSFVLDALGQRWVTDLGLDDYNLPGYFGPARFEYYRLRAEGQNVFVVNPDASAGQVLDVGGHVTRFDPDERSPSCEMDLSAAYPQLTAATRRLSLPGRRSVVIEDVLRAKEPATVWWFLHTRAAVTVDGDGREAVLEQGGRRLRVTLEATPSATLSIVPARPLPTSPDPEGQNPNDGSRVLNGVNGASFVRVGELPQYGPPDPAEAVRKLAVTLTGVTDAMVRMTFTEAN